MTTTDLETRIASALREGHSLMGKDGMLTPLIQRAVSAALEGEVESHLAESADNRRNGYNRKQVKSGSGMLEISTPRDRAGTFEPQLIKKRQTVLTAKHLPQSGTSVCIILANNASIASRTGPAIADTLQPRHQLR